GDIPAPVSSIPSPHRSIRTPIASASLWGRTRCFLLVPHPVRSLNPRNSDSPQKHHRLAPHPLCSRNPRCSLAVTPTAPDCRSGTPSSPLSFPRTLSYRHSLLLNLAPLNVAPLPSQLPQSGRGGGQRGGLERLERLERLDQASYEATRQGISRRSKYCTKANKATASSTIV